MLGAMQMKQPVRNPPVFALELRPNRSLDRRHFLWMIAGVAVIFLLMGIRFLALGAWPILPFMALDLALLWWAMRASYKSGQAVEELRLDAEGLQLVRISPLGHRQRTLIEPHWARVELEELGDQQNRLWLKSGQRRVPVGSFLSPPERVEIARVIEDGLERFRRAS